MERISLHAALLYSKWALEFLSFPPIASLFIGTAVSSVWAGLRQQPFRKHLWKRHHWLVLSHFFFFVAAIVVGLLWANDPRNHHPSSRAATFWLDTVIYGSLASCIIWTWQMKGFRWCAASLLALVEVITFGAIFVAGMSISGDWL